MSVYSYTIEEYDCGEDGIIHVVVEINYHESGEVYRNDVMSYPSRKEAEDCIAAIHADFAKAYATS